MGAGASTNHQPGGFKELIRAGLKNGAFSVRTIQTFINKETDLKAILKPKFPDVDFDHLNTKDVDYILDNLDDSMVQQLQNRLLGKGYSTPSIMGGKKGKRKTRRSKSLRKSRWNHGKR